MIIYSNKTGGCTSKDDCSVRLSVSSLNSKIRIEHEGVTVDSSNTTIRYSLPECTNSERENLVLWGDFEDI